MGSAFFVSLRVMLCPERPGQPRWRARLALAACAACVAGPSSAQEHDWMFGPFERPEGVNPIFTPNTDAMFECPMRGETVRWEEMATFNPAAVVRDGKIHVLYRAEDRLGEAIIGGHTSRIGLAWSDDGLHFTRRPAPVLYPDDDDQKEHEWPGGCEDPRIVETEDGTYVLMYTQWNHVRPQLAVATSTDLITWAKHGPLFPDLDRESKAGSIVSRVEGDRLVATRIDGSYWMYWSVPDVYIARSDDLISWTPVRDDRGDLLRVLNPRPGHFDSWLVEPGPPAILTEHGILLIYNAGNSGVYGDPAYGHRMYTGGQALYDRENPMRLIGRTDEPFIWPEMPYEKTGQYPEGTTFLEGMVPFQGKWFLYYGTADSRVAVVVWDPVRPAPPSFQEGLP